MSEEAGPLQLLLARGVVLEPEEVADSLWAAILADRFYVLPHPEVARTTPIALPAWRPGWRR